MNSLAQPGVLATLAVAILFGAGTPLPKLLLVQTSPWLLAAFLYLGSGVGLLALRLLRNAPSVQFPLGNGSGWPTRYWPEAWPALCC